MVLFLGRMFFLLVGDRAVVLSSTIHSFILQISKELSTCKLAFFLSYSPMMLCEQHWEMMMVVGAGSVLFFGSPEAFYNHYYDYGVFQCKKKCRFCVCVRVCVCLMNDETSLSLFLACFSILTRRDRRFLFFFFRKEFFFFFWKKLFLLSSHVYLIILSYIQKLISYKTHTHTHTERDSGIKIRE